MPGKTFAPITQSMLLVLERSSHGLRRESHPKRVAFLCLEIIRFRWKTQGHRGSLPGGPVVEITPGSGLVFRSGAVHVHLFPAAAEFLPDPGFAAASGDRITIDEFLRQTGVAHYH